MELDIREIRDHGGKEERLFIKVLQDCNLNDFIIYDETIDEEGNKSNIWPHMYRFDKWEVKKGEYVSLRVHKGKDKKGTLDDDKTVCYYLYWGFDDEVSILNKSGDTVHLVRVNGETDLKIAAEEKA